MNRNFMRRFVISMCVGIFAFAKAFSLERITAENYASYGFSEEEFSTYENYYAIANEADLLEFADLVAGANNATLNAVLTADIALTNEWTPIAFGEEINYAGTFDGNGHSVTNVMCNMTASNNVGFFSTIADGTVIRDLTISGDIRGYNAVGGICGWSVGNAIISNCCNMASISGGEWGVGGILGASYGENTTIDFCCNQGTVTISSSNGCGGICGGNGNVHINNSYVVKAPRSNDIFGSSHLSNCYYLTGISTFSNTLSYPGAFEPKSLLDFSNGTVCYLLNGSVSGGEMWRQNIGEDEYPTTNKNHSKVFYPAENSPCQRLTNEENAMLEHSYNENGYCSCGEREVIKKVTNENYEELGLSETYVGYYIIKNNSNLSSFTELVNSGNTSINAVLLADTYSNESPMANYQGTFDGNGHMITYNVSSSSQNTGFFSTLGDGAIVKNLTIDGNVTGTTRVGGICGSASGSASIINCCNMAWIQSSSSSGQHVGGICGYVSGSVSITNCYNKDWVMSDYRVDNMGGICGYATENASISNCMNEWTITARQSGTNVGGICGYATGNVSISNCGNKGSITANRQGRYVGGICGSANNDVWITNCSNKGSVADESDQGNQNNYVGGICGGNPNPWNGRCYIYACYNQGNVGTSNDAYVGGICGDGAIICDTYVTVAPSSTQYNVGVFCGGSNVGYNMNYYLEGIAGNNCNTIGGESKTSEVFANGTICYLFSISSDSEEVGATWRQNLGEDAYPTLDSTHSKVYFSGHCLPYGWTNDNTPIEHHLDEHGVCTVCGLIPFTYKEELVIGETVEFIDKFVISQPDQLQWFSNYVNSGHTNANAILANDIDMSGVTDWTAIGNATNQYVGKFDGMNHKITNLHVDCSEAYYGLFGNAASGTYVNVSSDLYVEHHLDEQGLCTVCGKLPFITESTYNDYGVSKTYVGYYIITNSAQLQRFSSMVKSGLTNANAILANDIDMSGVSDWVAIGNYTDKYEGNFDGLNHRIKNLIIDTDKAYQGLFGETRNGFNLNGVTIDKSCSIRGGNYTAAFVCRGSGTISNCGNEANLTGKNYVASFFANKTGTVTIRNSYNIGTITAEQNGYAIASGTGSFSANNCYNIGSVISATGNNSFIAKYKGSITNCFQLETIKFQEDVSKISTTAIESGALCYKLNGTLEQNYYEWHQTIGENSYPTFDVSQGTVYASSPCPHEFSNSPVTHSVEHTFENGFCTKELCDAYEPAILITAQNYEDLNVSSDYVGYYAVGNAGQLYWIGEYMSINTGVYNIGNYNVNVLLTDDIVVNEQVLESDGNLVSDISNLRKWEPIGVSMYDKGYKGTFDGNYHTISGLYCKITPRAVGSSRDIGLFGGLESTGTIQKIGVVDSYICGDGNVGGICGSSRGTIKKCYTECTIVSNSDGMQVLGGIAGFHDLNSGEIADCYSVSKFILGQTNNGQFYTGGLIGQSYSNSTNRIYNCYTRISSNDIYSLIGVQYQNYNNPAAKNLFYLQGSGKNNGWGGERTKTQFSSGEICYRLNEGETNEPVWTQTLNVDAWPMLGKGHKIVYYDEDRDFYYNRISLAVEESEFGTIVAGPCDTITNAEIKVEVAAIDGYEFKQWSNGATTNPIMVKMLYDTVLVPMYQPKTFPITYVTNGGTITTDEYANSYTYLQGTELPNNVENEGFTFAGWYENSTFTSAQVTEIPATAFCEKTFYAKWIAQNYAVNYHTNGGEVIGAVTSYTYGYGLTLTSDVSRSGYTFAGWYDNEDCTGNRVYNISITDFGNKEYWAKWNVKSYAINYVVNEGTLSGEYATTYEYGTKTPLPQTIAREGYDFLGWFVNSNYDGSAIDTVSSLDFGDKTYYAKWQAKSFSIALEPNGGVINSGNITHYTYGNTAILPVDVTKTGHAFAGWYENPDFSDDAVLSVSSAETGDKTYYANWQPNTYAITYNTLGGAIVGESASNYTYGTATALPTTVTKDGCEFVGWYTNSSFDGIPVEQVDSEDFGNKQFWARWSIKSYTVSYELDGGVINSGEVSSYNFGVGAALPTNVVKSGFTFAGWYETDDFSDDEVKLIPTDAAEDKIFYAKWNVNTYTITYNANGGVIEDENVVTTYTIGNEVVLPSAVSKTGFEFAGWFGNSNLTGERFTKVSSLDFGNKEFFAKWNVKTYSVTLETNGGTINSGNVVAYTYSNGAVLPIDVTQNGYSFAGWYETADFSGEAVLSVPLDASGDKTYYANWQPNTYAINYNTLGGAIVGESALNYTYGTTTALPTTVTKDGSEFIGWYTNSSFDGIPVEQIDAEDFGDKQFWARWSIKSYTVSYELDGGVINSGEISSYNFGVGAALPTNVVKSGFTFAGWYETADFSDDEEKLIPTDAAENKIFFAKWNVNTYTITYNANGGVIEDENVVATYTIGNEFVLPSAVSKTGFEFAGWFGNSNLTGERFTKVSSLDFGNKEFFAKWNVKTYAVTLETNGGTINSGNVVAYTYSNGAVLPIDVTQNGYSFAGWYETADFSGEAVLSVPLDASGDKTYYAKWNVNSYAITFITNDGVINEEQIIENYTFGEGATLPTDVTKEGYTFDGWFINSSYTGASVRSISASDFGDKTYYANWVRNTYSVSVDYNRAMGFVDGIDIYRHGDEATLRAKADAGFEFVTWNCDDEDILKNKSVTDSILVVTVTKPIALTATFKQKEFVYTIGELKLDTLKTETELVPIELSTLFKASEDGEIFYVATSSSPNVLLPQVENGNLYLATLGVQGKATITVIAKLANGEKTSLSCETFVEYNCDIHVTAEITNASCYGTKDGGISLSAEQVYTYKWLGTDITSTKSDTLSAGNYAIEISDERGCKVLETYTVSQPEKIVVAIDTVVPFSCDKASEIRMKAEGDYNYLWSDGSTSKDLIGAAVGSYTVTVTDPSSQCSVQLSQAIELSFKKPEISLVTVSKLTGKNLIVWVRENTDQIDYYTIYRETENGGEFEAIGTVKQTEISVFEDDDENVDPKNRSWSYRISATDFCGNETELSDVHTTIHLLQPESVREGYVDLSWNPYVGVDYSSFIIIRETKLPSFTFVDTVTTVPSSIRSYSAEFPPIGQTMFYIGIKLNKVIDPKDFQKAESGPFIIAISNIAELENMGEPNAVETAENNATVYAIGHTIYVMNPDGLETRIFDSNGRNLMDPQERNEIEFTVKLAGVYFVKVGTQSFKVLIQ